MDGFSIGRLPSEARQMLRELPDEHSMRLGHEASMAEMRSFWNSLDPDQTLFVAKLLRRIADDDDPAAKAGMYSGNAEMVLHLRHGGCICGELHKDPDDLLQELTLLGNVRAAEDEACDLYKLRRTHAHDLMGRPTTVFVCLECGHAWDTIDQRREAGGPGACPGCNHDTE